MIEIHDEFYVLKEEKEEWIIPKGSIAFINYYVNSKKEYVCNLVFSVNCKKSFKITKKAWSEIQEDYKSYLKLKYKKETTVFMDSSNIRGNMI